MTNAHSVFHMRVPTAFVTISQLIRLPIYKTYHREPRPRLFFDRMTNYAAYGEASV